MADQATVDAVKQALNEYGSSGSNSSPKAAAPNATPVSTKGVEALDKSAETASGSLWKLFDASKDLAVAFGGAKQTIGNEAAGVGEQLNKMGAPGFVKMIGDASSKTGQLGQVQEQAAAGLGSSFMKMNNDLRSAGLTVQDYQRLMQQSNGSLDNFSTNAVNRANELSESGKKLIDTAQQSGLNQKMGNEELGKVMLLSQMGRKDALNTEKAQADAAKQAHALAEGINEMATRTGKSRDVIEAEMADRLSSVEVSTKLRLANEEQRKAIIEGQLALTGMGKGAAEAGTAIQNNGRLSNDQILSLMAMGPKARAEFEQGNRRLATARTEEERQAAMALIEKSKVDKAAYQSTQQFSNMVNRAPDDIKAGLVKSVQEDKEAGGINAARRQAAGTGATPGQVRERQVEEASNLAKGRTSTGQVDPNVAPTAAAAAISGSATNQANQALKIMNDNLSVLANSKEGQKVLGDTLHAIYGKGGSMEKDMANAIAILKQNLKPGTNESGTATGPQAGPVPEPPKKKALGGPIEPNDLYMVGEQGPELFKSKQAGDIVPNDKLGSMFGGIQSMISSVQKPQTQAPAPAPAPAPAQPAASTTGGSTKELHDQMVRLNTTMEKMLKATLEISNHSEKTAKNSGKATGNRTLA